MTAEDRELGQMLEAIYRIYHYDFRSYSTVSLARRVGAAQLHFACASTGALTDRVAHEPLVFAEMLRFLTVQVSDMFRDPEYFRALRDVVVPHLRTYASLKLWVAGCATGEEAYSLAIVLAEEGLLERSLIYATDINPGSLRIAAEGAYAVARLPRFVDNHARSGGLGALADHYATAYGRAVFDRRLRKAIVFSDHSLATDAVFAETQVVSCRNVLIYFDRELQDRALGVMRDSLCHKGFLGLGMRETLAVTRHLDAFTELAPEVRLYRKR